MWYNNKCTYYASENYQVTGILLSFSKNASAINCAGSNLGYYRAIGFSVMNVSNLWTLQSVSQLLLSTIVVFPAGILVSKILFTLCSSVNQMYPLIISVRYALYAFLFILVIIFLTHTLAMLSIKRWNIANNTRSRE